MMPGIQCMTFMFIWIEFTGKRPGGGGGGHIQIKSMSRRFESTLFETSLRTHSYVIECSLPLCKVFTNVVCNAVTTQNQKQECY